MSSSADPRRAVDGAQPTGAADAPGPGFRLLFDALADPCYLWRREGGSWSLAGWNAAAAAVPHELVAGHLGGSPESVVGAAEGRVLRGRLDLCVELGRPVAARRSHRYRGGARRELRVSWQPLGPDLVVVTAVDETEAAERARREREVETAELSGLTRTLVLAPGVQEARDALCGASLALSGADRVHLLEPLAGRLERTAAAVRAGASPDRGPVALDPAGGSLWARALATGRPEWTPDLRGQTGAPEPAPGTGLVLDLRGPVPAPVPAPAGSGMRGALAEPVVLGSRVLGVLAVGWDRPLDAPPERAQRLLPLLAATAAAALERAELVAQLRSDAMRDPLTALPNRRAWEEELERDTASARRSGEPLSVAVLDVDGLKAVNDTRGHAAGDQLLREAARAWSGALRRQDLLARLGGDEFGVLLAGTDATTAAEVLARVAAAAPGCPCSVGVVERRPGESVRDLLHRADIAMYADKVRKRAVAESPQMSRA